MLDIIEEIEDREIDCRECNGRSSYRVFILKDSRPSKIVHVKDCPGCGLIETTQEDYETLDYEVKITCDFTSPRSAEEASMNLGRMCFINNNTKVSIFYESELLLDFICDTCHIDCIQGLLMRGEDIFSLARASEGNEEIIKRISECLTRIIEGEGFKLVIEDESGFSRVCPHNKEYIEVQDNPIESFEEENIRYERISK